MKQQCIIHYASKNQMPDPKWREKFGRVLVRGRGPGPKNMLVMTNMGTVVVPRGNVRYVTAE
jgi:hypothetical protein